MKQSQLFPVRAPLVVANGLGVDSMAMLIRLRNLGRRPDLILFADTGGEKHETYAYEQVVQDWLAREGFPPLVTVSYTLEDNCLTNGTLPGISFGPASCSVKWKQAPQHAYIKRWQPALDTWAGEERVIKCIGFDASPADRARTYRADPKDAHIYEYVTPLIEAGWDRAECIRQIQREGLPVPPKSSCFFCCAMKPWEVAALEPDFLRRIVRMEARAHPRLRSCEGLWRSTVKGTRGGTPRPGSMTTYIREQKLLPTEEVQHLWENTFSEIIRFQEGWAQARADGTLHQFTAQDYRSHPPDP
jgi:hypothetical protein